MKVMLINGSSHADGCTALALRQAATALEEEGIETETIFIGSAPLADCTACHGCAKTHKCVFNDIVNEITEKAASCDGFIFGSPVYYAHPSARLQAVLDRAFYSCGQSFAFKPGAAVVSARRSGTTASFDVINKYFTISNMPVVSSTYWNNIHGNAQTEGRQLIPICLPDTARHRQLRQRCFLHCLWLFLCRRSRQGRFLRPCLLFLLRIIV